MTPNPTTFSKKRTKHEQDKNGRKRNQGRLTSRYLRWKRRTDEGTERSDGGERERERGQRRRRSRIGVRLCSALRCVCLALLSFGNGLEAGGGKADWNYGTGVREAQGSMVARGRQSLSVGPTWCRR
ncbi:hypothetical protein BHE74_00034632 [Ensete ventricosum]|nr:hypothetical protein BHE74_00034632 [Ensete ventricosum]RZR91233.1 hypothetical protein BHM03_00019324 [Ensete ventricosum]